MKFLGHVYIEEDRKITEEFKTTIEYISENLSEVKITVNSN
jgi:hypothetical protein